MDLRLNLSLTEEDDGYLILSGQSADKYTNGNGNSFLLVGRLLSHQNTNFEALMQPVKGMVVRRISEDRFCLQFNHKLDMQRVMEGRPWIFDKNLLILEPVIDDISPTDICLDWSPFTVYVHDSPLSLQNRNTVELIGNKIGMFIDIEHSNEGGNWFAAWKLIVAINVSNPLKESSASEMRRRE
ncbi:UNVERIFIED_CONTAM: hypothetical protein Slati_3572300 [Sesamum latifolium]|uniref:DUF4283 domain-containing protein n=1 Tax=Sesamum latifolium TaxID=2727402 RepID=A0AAW2U2E6_9LAMI